MEPLTALSLASNVIQIVDFRTRVISKSSELYKSHDGRLVQHTDIATTASDLKQLTTKLSEGIATPLVPTVLSEDEFALHVLCKGCIDVSLELQSGLNKLQVQGAPSKWKSLRKALKSIWTKEHIAELQTRLAGYRERLDSRVLIDLKSKLDVVQLQQVEGFDKLEEDVKAAIEAVLDSTACVELKVERRAAITDSNTRSSVLSAQATIVDAVGQARRSNQQDIEAVGAQLTII